MKHLMHDLGDLTGLDMLAAARWSLIPDGPSHPPRAPTRGALAFGWNLLRRFGFAVSTDSDRSRLDGWSDADATRPSSYP